MALGKLVIAIGIICTASPSLANNPEPAPSGTPETKYCMRVDITGRLNDTVVCWTRTEWAEQGVDVDKDWAKDGVRVIG